MKGYKHLTAAQKTEVLRVYEETGIVSVTAQSVGASDEQVRRYLKRQGVELTKAQERSVFWQNRETVIRLATEGVSLSEICRQVGGNRRHLKAFLERLDISYTPWDRSAPENNPFWRGGRIVDQDGYVLLKRPDHPNCDRHGYVREHRLVMEAKLGRYLTKDEIVHHIDGDKAHNDPSNLAVFAANGAHLAETLKGVPKRMTPEGRAKLRAIGRQRQRARRMSSQQG